MRSEVKADIQLWTEDTWKGGIQKDGVRWRGILSICSLWKVGNHQCLILRADSLWRAGKFWRGDVLWKEDIWKGDVRLRDILQKGEIQRKGIP